MDAITPVLGLIKPVVGDEAGEDLWGEKTNDNWDTLDAAHQSLQTSIDGLDAVNEAPDDGQAYVRFANTWTPISIGIIPGLQPALDEKIGEAPTDGALYGRDGSTGSWLAIEIAWNDIVGKPPIIDEAPLDGSLYARQSAGWTQIGGAYVGDTPPPLPVPNTFWYESDTGYLLLRYNDGNSEQWVQVNNAGLTDAPSDGKSYGRKNGAWAEVTVTVAWGDITGIPATFPPSAHTHAYSSLTGIPATFPPSAHTHDYSTLTGIPATFPPSAHSHPQSEVTGLVAAQAAQDSSISAAAGAATAANTNANGREPAIATGDPAMFWAGDKTWKAPPAGGISGAGVATQLAYWTGAAALAGDTGLTFNATQNRLSIHGGELPTGSGLHLHNIDDDSETILWPDNNVLKVVNQAAGGLAHVDAGGFRINGTPISTGLADAPSDGTAYGRLSAAWAAVLPLAGGTLTGKLITKASATGGAGLNLIPGVAPSSPANGDIWTTTAGLFARVNGTTKAYQGVTVSTADPSGGADGDIWFKVP